MGWRERIRKTLESGDTGEQTATTDVAWSTRRQQARRVKLETLAADERATPAERAAARAALRRLG